MSFDIIGAKNAGYSDGEIINTLADKHKFDVTGAREAGHDDSAILGALLSREEAGVSQPPQVDFATQGRVRPAASGLSTGSSNLYPAGTADPITQTIQNTAAAPRMPQPTPIVQSEQQAPDLVSALNMPVQDRGAATRGFMSEVTGADTPEQRANRKLGITGFGNGSEQSVIGIASDSDKQAAANANQDVSALATMPATGYAGVVSGVGSLQTFMGYAPENDPIYANNPSLMAKGLSNMSEADMVKAQIEKDRPAAGILTKALREGAFQLGNMAPTMPLAAIPGIGADLALGAMAMGASADAIQKGKEIGLTDEEIKDYQGKLALPEYAGEKANFGVLLSTLSGKYPFIKQTLKLFGSEFLGEAGTSHVQFAADKAYEKPGLTKEERDKIFNSILSGEALAKDKKLRDEYVEMQKETAVSVAGMTALSAAGGKAYHGLVKAATPAEETPTENPVASVQALMSTLPPDRGPLSRAARQILIAENEDPSAAANRIAARQGLTPITQEGANVPESVYKENATPEVNQQSEVSSEVSAPAESVKPSETVDKGTDSKVQELEKQASTIQEFIDLAGDSPELSESVASAKENLAAIQAKIAESTPAEAVPASAPAETKPAEKPASGLSGMVSEARKKRGSSTLTANDGISDTSPVAKNNEAPALNTQPSAGMYSGGMPSAPDSQPVFKQIPTAGKGTSALLDSVEPRNTPKLNTAPKAGMYSELGNMKTQGQMPQGKGDFVPIPGEDGKGGFKPIPKKAKGGDTNGEKGRVQEEIKRTKGKSGKAFSSNGDEIAFHYAVVEADDLVASHTPDGSINPNYPQEIQPRDREKASSQLQIKQISQALRPAQLGDSAKVSSGSPFIGPDGVVESGNGRTLGIKLAYDNAKAGEYRAWLEVFAKNNAGIDVDAIKKMKRPVLVRVRDTQVDRAEFARQANQGGMAAMSPAETAKADAARLNDDMLSTLNVPEDGNLLAAGNRQFVKAFLSKMGSSAAAGLTDKQGNPTRQLADRMQAAIFAKAYGDDRLIAMMAEESDVEIKNIIAGLNAAAPTFAKLEDKTIAKKLTEAINIIRDAKNRGLTLNDLLDQESMFESRDEEAAALARKIDKSRRSSKKLGELFKSLSGQAAAAEDFASQDNLFGEKPKTAADIIKDTVETEKPAQEPTKNTVFTEDAAAAARERLKKKLSQLNSGIDPEMMMDGITLAGYHIEKGARTFAAYAKAMIEDLGEAVKPYLKSWYMGVKYDPRAVAFDGMDTASAVEGYDESATESAEEPTDFDPTISKSGYSILADNLREPVPGSTEEAFAKKYPNSPWLRASGVFDKNGEFERSKDLTPEQQAVEDALFQRLMENPEKFMQEYLNVAHPVDGKPGNRTLHEIMKTQAVVINPDEGRVLSSEYEHDPNHYAGATHEPLSAVTKMVGAKALMTIDPRGLNQIVVLSGGGGSGKGSYNKASTRLTQIDKEASILFDGTMSKESKLNELIKAAYEYGKTAHIVHVHRTLRGATKGIVKRKWDGAKLTEKEGLIPGRNVGNQPASEAHFHAGPVFVKVSSENQGLSFVKFYGVVVTDHADEKTVTSAEVSLDTLAKEVENKTAGYTFPEFKALQQQYYQEFDSDPRYNPYIEGGEKYEALRNHLARYAGGDGHGQDTGVRPPLPAGPGETQEVRGERTPVDGGDSGQSERGLQGQRGIDNPSEWWKNLSVETRKDILEQLGSNLSGKVIWKVIPKELKETILTEWSDNNVSVNSDENARTGSDTTVAEDGRTAAADNGPSGDVAGQQPQEVQEPVATESDNATPATADTDVTTGVGPGSGPGSVSGPSPVRNVSDVQPPAHVVGSSRNFTITNELDFDGVGNTTKTRNNIEAIKILKRLSAEQRPATPEEQTALAKYVGWGGIPNVFNAKSKEYSQELADLLTPEEYERARNSTQNAHYTAKEVVDSIWQAVQRLGFDRGTVLEPSVGTGNFIGLMPRELRSMSKITGVELDPTTAAIAANLYPQSRINNKGFQEIKIVPNSFDLAIGNPPFGSNSLFDADSKARSKFKIHGYFFAKSVDSLRPGGVLAMVVSKGFMDANDATGKAQRDYVAERTKLLGAIRLPDSAFKKNAGTEVTTDIIFLQKLQPGESSNFDQWDGMAVVKDRETGDDIAINEYFVNNPNMMLGEMTLGGKMYRAKSATLSARPGDNLSELLQKAIDNLPEKVMTHGKDTAVEVNNGNKGLTKVYEVRPYNHFEEDGKIYQRLPDENGNAVTLPVELEGKTAERMRGMIELRDAVRRQLTLEANERATGSDVEQNRKRINKLYDSFIEKFGHLNNDTNKRIFWSDADSPLIRSLEKNYDKGLSKDLAKKQGKTEKPASAKKADIFTKRVLVPSAVVTKVETAPDALAASMNEKGRIDFDYMASIYGKPEAEIIPELGELMFEDPSQGWQTADKYLSGNVKSKLAEAILAAKEDPKYNRNVLALEKVQPKDRPAADISVMPHSCWLPEEVFHQFAEDIFKGTMSGKYSSATGRWDVRFTTSDAAANTTKYGTRRMAGTTIMSSLMANKQIAVFDTTDDDKKVLNKDETAAAQGKADELLELFQDWIWKDQDRRAKVVRRFNDLMNTNVKESFDGSHLTLPGKVPTFVMRPHQLNVIHRGVQSGVVLYDHVVGSGKTAIMTATVMELRRLGLANKPMITVPNHLVEQWSASFQRIYPNAKVLAATKKDFKGENRRQLFAKIATGDWDVVIVAHSSFKFIPLPYDTQVEILNEQKQAYVEAIEEAKADKGKSLSVKKLEAARDRIDAKLKKLADSPKDEQIDFQEMGIDTLFVDEAHEFKNLFYTTTMQNVAGLGSPNGSGRAFDMFVKTQYLMRRNGGKGVYFATGTPVSNSLAEVFHMQRFLQYGELKARGIHNFDAWASSFGKVEADWEQDAGGRFKQKVRFRKLVNLPALKQLWGSVTDTVTNPEIMADAEAQGKPFYLPKIEGGKPTNMVVERSPQQARYIGIPHEMRDSDGHIVYNSENGMPIVEYDPGTIVYRMDNWMEEFKRGNTREMPLVITGDARKAGLDYRLIDEEAPDFAGSKVNTAVNEIFNIYKDNDSRKGTQLVFCDLSTPKSHKGKSLEKLAETVPTYFVRDYVGSPIYHVPGKPVKITAAPDEEFFYHKKGKQVTVYEKYSGLKVASGSNVTEAKDNANVRINNMGLEAFTQEALSRQIPTEQIDEYLVKWEEEQDAKEDTNDEETGPESSVSFDDILADSGKSNFSVYDDMKAKLIARGIPEDQIAFIHDYDTDAQKAALFSKVKNGTIRVLFGSTAKMGAGTNVQDRLVGLHHMDAPWKPSDLAQREGRIVRQGNVFADPNKGGEEYDPSFKVKIRRYATKQTYDSRMWEIIETKAKAIELFRTSGDDVLEVEDISSESANAAEIKAASAGNPLMLEDLQLKNDIKKYEAMEKSWKRSRYELEDLVSDVKNKTAYPYTREEQIQANFKGLLDKDPEKLGLAIDKKTYDTKEDFDAQVMGTAIKTAFIQSGKQQAPVKLGSYRGATLKINGQYGNRVTLEVYGPNGKQIGETHYGIEEKFSPSGLITRLDNIIDAKEGLLAANSDAMARLEASAKEAENELEKPFKYTEKLNELRDRRRKVLEALRAGRETVGDDTTAEVMNEYEKLGKWRSMFKVSEDKAQGVPVQDVELRMVRLARYYPNAPAYQVVKDETGLPPSTQRDINSLDANGLIRGVYASDGRIYIVAGNLNSVDEAVPAFLHEAVAHYGLRDMLGKRFNTVLQQIVATRGKAGLKEIANRYKLDLSNQEDRLIAAEEMLAEWAERNEKPGFVNRAVAMLRDWIRKAFPSLKWTDNDIKALIARAAGHVSRQEGTASYYDGNSFMVAAWHGSPADHDSFNTDYIGSGEGAQAYGWGLYFSDSKGVAEYYRDALGKWTDIKYEYDGKPVQLNTQRIAMGALDNARGDKNIAAKDLSERTSLEPNELESVLRQLDKIEYSKTKVIGKPRLYQVELAPEDNELLNWDKPVPEDLLRKVSNKMYDDGHTGDLDREEAFDALENEFDRRGELLYRGLSEELGSDKAASDFLYSLGIRGIKYYGGQAGGQATGHYNYVIFTGDDVKIKNKFLISPNTEREYNARIDELFKPGAKPNMKGGVRIIDRSDVMGMMGYGNKPIELVEGKLIKGITSHGLSKEDWKKVPKWLENPAFVFDSDTERGSGRLVFVAKDLVNNAPVVMIIDPASRSLEAHVLINAYDKAISGVPFKRWVSDGLLRYYDKNKSASLDRSGLSSTGLSQAKRFDGSKIYRDADLVKYKNIPNAPVNRFSIRSTDPDVEARWQASRGLGDNKPTVKETIAELKDRIIAETTQHFPEIDMSTRAGKRTADILRRFEAAGQAAKSKAVSHLQTLTKGFNSDQMELFTRAVILSDLMGEAAKGHKLPFGYTPATLVADHQAISAMVRQSPEVQTALQHRKDINREMVLQLIENGLIPVGSVIKESSRARYEQTGEWDETDINTDYFRHQVLAHAAAKQWAGVSTAGEVRNKKRGWMKKREGSERDINTNFLEAEFEWFTQALKEIATKKTLDEVLKVNDIHDDLKAEAKRQGVDDWKELIPEGYTIWQPVKGSAFYKGATLSEEAVTRFIDENPAFSDVADQFRTAIIRGARRYEAVIPEGLATTLDNIRDSREGVLLDSLNKKLLGAWKINTLLNPRRVIKYNLNNMSGDMDAAIAADPAILKYLGTAFKNALARKTGNLSDADKDVIDRGVLDSGISINEIPDINKLPGFKGLSDADRSAKLLTSLKTGNISALMPQNLIAKYFDFVSGWTQVREGLLREAAYLRALDLLRDGKKVYWASDPREVDSIPDVKDRAAKLSRELLGDYGNLSATGEKIRTSFVPFWSWMEINAPRYYRIFKNATMQGEGGSNLGRMAGVGANKAAGAALGIAEKALLVQLLFALVSLYNRLVWPDEEEALGENGRKQLHVILGKGSDGKIISVRFQGAFSDVLSWFGLEDYPSMIRRYSEGKLDKEDAVKKILLAAPSKMANASMPFWKLGAELITGKSIYPDVSKPTQIRDRSEHAARFLSLDEEYRALAGKPTKGYGDGIKSTLAYETDPGEQAYNEMRQQVFKFMEKNGKDIPASEPTKRSNALYYYRQALRYNDKEAAAKYMALYKKEGGKPMGIKDSIDRAAPLAALPANMRFKFRSQLSAADRIMLDKANEWYRQVYHGKK